MKSSKKKIVHFSTLSSGGAFRALEGIHSHVDRSRFESTILFPPLAEGLSKISQIIQQECVWANRSQLSNSYFSLDFSLHKIPERKTYETADLIHLHWVADWLDSTFLKSLASLDFPVVWTLHDLRPLTGGCHFPAGCRKWMKFCEECPQLVDQMGFTIPKCFRNQQNTVEALKPIFVAPSRWLYNACKNSKIGGGCRVELIPYGVDHHLFSPGDKMAERRIWNLPQDRRVFLIVAQQISEKRKGYQEVFTAWQQILQTFRPQPPPLLVCVGETVRGIENLPEVIQLGIVRDVSRMRSVYQAADIFLIPSHEDNLPNVALEAMASGLPILAGNTGGLPDLVQDGHGGLLLAEISTQSLEFALRSLITENSARLNQMGAENRAKIQKNFTLDQQARSYEVLYEDAISSFDRGNSWASAPENEPLDAAELLACACLRNRAEISKLYNLLHEQLRYIRGMEKKLTSSRVRDIFGKLLKSIRTEAHSGQ